MRLACWIISMSIASSLLACRAHEEIPEVLPREEAGALVEEKTDNSAAIDGLQREIEGLNEQSQDLQDQILKKEQELATAQASGKLSQAEIDAIKAQLEADRKRAEEAAAQAKALEEQLKKTQSELEKAKTPMPATQLPTAAPTVIERTKVAFVFQHNTQYCLDMAGDGVTNGTNIQVYRCGDTPSQWFDLHRLSNGSYHIVRNNYVAGRPQGYQCVHIANSSQDNGANVETYTCDGGGSQTFQLLDQGGGVFMLRNTRSGKCIDAQNGGAANGVNVIQFDCQGNMNQKLRMVQR